MNSSDEKPGSESARRESTLTLRKTSRSGNSLAAIDLAAVTHPGHVRENNEDHYLIAQFGRSLKTVLTNLDEGVLAQSYDFTGYGLLVADGLGGLAAGEVASSTALAKLVELVVETPDWMLGLRREQDVSTVVQRMTQRFMKIDQTLKEQAERDTTLRGMGTTLTVAATLGNDMIVGHVGDSRAYLFHDQRLMQLTTDHTLAQALIDAGVARPDEPATRSTRHVLTAALGSPGQQVDPQIHRGQLSAGDQILLCTDGLTEMVDDRTISNVLQDTTSAQGACQSLVNLALAAGGLDNITVVLARFDHLPFLPA